MNKTKLYPAAHSKVSSEKKIGSVGARLEKDNFKALILNYKILIINFFRN